MEKIGIVEGWTGAMDFQLTEDDAAPDLTGATIVAEARNKSRQAVTLSGDLTLLSATGGQVRLQPDTGDFLAEQSPYELRFKRTSPGGIVFYPNEDAIVVEVRPWL